MVVVRSFCFGLQPFSPLALIAKNGDFESPFNTLSPIGKRNMSDRLYQFESLWNTDKVVNDTVRVGVEALTLPNTPFPFQSKTSHRDILESTLVLVLAQENKKYAFVPNERGMIKGM
jgi:hypothetical protein